MEKAKDNEEASVVSSGLRARQEGLYVVGGAQGLFGADDIVLDDTVMVDICHYEFVETHKMYDTKSDLNRTWTLVSNIVSILAHEV